MRKIIILWLVLIVAILNITFACYAVNVKIDWTEDELIFMENHPIIRLGVDPKFVPFEFMDEDGQHKGIAADCALYRAKNDGRNRVVKASSLPDFPAEAYGLLQ